MSMALTQKRKSLSSRLKSPSFPNREAAYRVGVTKTLAEFLSSQATAHPTSLTCSPIPPILTYLPPQTMTTTIDSPQTTIGAHAEAHQDLRVLGFAAFFWRQNF
jgi:hypothetical protein